MINSKSSKKYGFTLMELMVAVIIIAVLAAVAVPQYKKAVLKSRFSTLMPVANSLAKGNEVYYLSQGEYSKQESKLDVEGQLSVPEGTEITLETDPEYLSYVRVSNESKVPNARYVVYQAHSKNFAGTTMCEAKDDTAKELCQSLGGVFVSENGTESNWTAYLLSGELGAGDSFEIPCPDNSTSCDDQGKATECESEYTISSTGKCVSCSSIDNAVSCSTTSQGATECASGYTLNNGECVSCSTISNAATCSTTSYRATSCETGCVQNNGTCGTCNVSGDTVVTSGTSQRKTYGDNAVCFTYCGGNTYSGHARCAGGLCQSLPDSTTRFTDHSSCTKRDGGSSRGSCMGAVFDGNASCDGGNCSSDEYYTTTFIDNSTCKGDSICYGAVFGGNSTCTSTSSNGCSKSGTVSTFKENAVCNGNGCNTANYEGNACCNNCSVGSSKPKCGGGVW